MYYDVPLPQDDQRENFENRQIQKEQEKLEKRGRKKGGRMNRKKQGTD